MNNEGQKGSGAEIPKYSVRKRLFKLALILIGLQFLILLKEGHFVGFGLSMLSSLLIGNLIILFPIYLMIRWATKKGPERNQTAFEKATIGFAIFFASGLYAFMTSSVPAETTDQVLPMKLEVMNDSVLFYLLSFLGF